MEIITTPALQNYLGPIVDGIGMDRINLIVDLANGIVSDAWSESETATTAPTWVTAIAYEVAARPLRNPGGLASITRHIDDASRTERLSDLAARAGVFLTDEEERRLRNRGNRRRRGRYGTIRLGIG